MEYYAATFGERGKKEYTFKSNEKLFVGTSYIVEVDNADWYDTFITITKKVRPEEVARNVSKNITIKEITYAEECV